MSSIFNDFERKKKENNTLGRQLSEGFKSGIKEYAPKIRSGIDTSKKYVRRAENVGVNVGSSLQSGIRKGALKKGSPKLLRL